MRAMIAGHFNSGIEESRGQSAKLQWVKDELESVLQNEVMSRQAAQRIGEALQLLQLVEASADIHGSTGFRVH